MLAGTTCRKKFRRICVLIGATAQAAALAIGAAGASCVQPSDAALVAIDALVGRDPTRAIEQADRILASRNLAPEYRARVLAIKGEAFGRTSQADKALETVRSGAGLALAPESQARVELLWLQATNTFRRDALDTLAPTVSREAEASAPYSAAGICLKIALGNIERMRGNIGAAARHLTMAYRESDAPSLVGPHMEAARLLARLLGDAGNVSAALQLNQQVIEFETANQQEFLLGFAHGFRGIYLNRAKRFDEALPELGHAIAAARKFGDPMGEAYLNQQICSAEIGLKQWASARNHCNLSGTALEQRKDDGFYQTQVLLAEIDLAEQDPAGAKARLTRVINEANGSSSVNQFEPFRLRAEANKRLGDVAAALDDYRRYMQGFEGWSAATRDREAVVSEERFQTDLQVARNRALEEALKYERENAAAKRLNGAVAIALLLLASLLLVRLHVAERRHRKQLADLANTDSLTGIANRRHTADHVVSALSDAERADRPLSLALIDVDHFKSINDTYGHAAGDKVLREIAQTATAWLPESSLIGRWGGEEFLIVFQGRSEAATEAVLEKLRNLISELKPAGDAGRPLRFSAGIAGCRGTSLSARELIDRADKALYRAKNEGRGRTCIYKEPDLHGAFAVPTMATATVAEPA